MKKNKIFIQIASYRDPQLLPTIKDCLENANNPNNLVFSIAWQHSKEDIWDNLDEFKNDRRFKIIDIDYKESKGACWARNFLQQQYDGEEYTLQLDSHHRFIKNWDVELIKMIKQLQKKGHKKPLLTGYMLPEASVQKFLMILIIIFMVKRYLLVLEHIHGDMIYFIHTKLLFGMNIHVRVGQNNGMMTQYGLQETMNVI